MNACAVEGCEGARVTRGYCRLHYVRLMKRGEVGGPARERAVNGHGHIDKDGYRQLKRPEHPLARASGAVLEHRVLLYDALGEGPQACHWCGCDLAWRAASLGSSIVVDHLNGDRLDNALSNLVPACLQCNANRGRNGHLRHDGDAYDRANDR